MKICVTQREGIRFFTRFADVGERDKLEVELRIEDKTGKTIMIDLTEALIEEYSKHPEIGRVSMSAVPEQIVGLRPLKASSPKASKAVSPAYVSESKKNKDDLIARVREAQLKAAEERKAKEAEFNAARAERLAAARKVKADKAEAEAKKAAKKTPPAKPGNNGSSKPSKAKAAGLTKTQETAIKKIGKALATEDKNVLKLTSAPTKAKTTAPAVKAAAKAAKETGGSAKAVKASKPAPAKAQAAKKK